MKYSHMSVIIAFYGQHNTIHETPRVEIKKQTPSDYFLST